MKLCHFIVFFCLLGLSSETFSLETRETRETRETSNINVLLDEDNYSALEELKTSIEKNESDLKLVKELELRLSDVNAHKPVYLQVNKIAGAATIVGILFASYHIYFPPTLRVVMAAFFAVKWQSQGSFKLSLAQIKSITTKVNDAKTRLLKINRHLELKRKFYCQTNVPHILCRI